MTRRSRDFFEVIDDFTAGPLEVLSAGVMGALLGALVGLGVAEMLSWPILPCVVLGAVALGAALGALRHLGAREEGDA